MEAGPDSARQTSPSSALVARRLGQAAKGGESSGSGVIPVRREMLTR